MANFLTGSPSSSQATGSNLAKALQPTLQGLLNPGGGYTITPPKKSGGGKGGIFGALTNPLGAIGGGGAAAIPGLPGIGGGGGNPLDPSNITNPLGVFGGGSTHTGAPESTKAFLVANPELTKSGSGYTSPIDIANLPKGWTETATPNRASSLASLSLDPTQLANTTQALSQYSDPNYLDVANQPYTKDLVSALTNESNTNLQQNLAGLRSQFANYGQTGAGTASPLAQTEGEAVSQTQQTLNDQIAQQLFAKLQSQQGLQLQGLSAEQQQNMLPANLLASLAPLLSKSKGATPSPLQAISQLVSSVGSVAGAAAGL